MSKATLLILISICFVLFNCETKKQKIQNKVSQASQFTKLSAPELAQKASEIDNIMQKKEANGFSGNVLVAQHNQIIFQKSYGFADQKDSTPNTIDTRFQLASISKTFTAVAIMQLVEKRKLKLEQNVQDFIPNFPYAGITIFTLLTHRSGLPFYQYTFDKLVRGQNLFPVNQNIMSWFEKTIPTPSIFNQPNRFFSYNNTNFIILASIVEKVSHQSFHTYLQNNIFKPLNMNQTFVILPNTNLNIKTIAHGHQFGRRLDTDWYDFVYGDKGVYTTTGDLFKYYQGLRDAKLLKAGTIQEMFKPRSFEKVGKRNYGYGFRLSLDENKDVKAVFHTGWWKGFNTIFFTVPKEDILIILLGNKYNHSAYDVKSIWAALSVDPTSPSITEDEEDGE